MTKFTKQLISVVAGSAMMLSIAAPALADTSITISGNGSDSNNTTSVENTNSTTVLQSNTATVSNTVNANADTGGNSAKDNTGGNVTVSTGNATTNTTVANTLNSNVAQAGCNCGNGDTTVTVSGNGSESQNAVALEQGAKNQVTQSNEANVTNKVNADAKTGDNYAGDNTGGNTSILTGDASTTSNVSTTANANVAQIGSGLGQGAGSLSAIISGNGSESENAIALSNGSENNIWQANSAYVKNSVDADASSGGNKAKDNTGGNVTIATGMADAAANVDNSVNFNAANVDCGCLLDVMAKIAGNGTDSENTLSADLGGTTGVYQGGEDFGNHANLNNYVNPSGKSGDNYASDNTGPVIGDPTWVITGDSSSTSSVSNTGNVNTYGTPFELPGVSGVNFSFDFQSFMAQFGFSM